MNHFGVELLIKILVLLSSDAYISASHFLLVHLRTLRRSLIGNRFGSFMNHGKILLEHGRLTSNHVFIELLLLLLNQIVIELSVTKIFSSLTTYQVILLLHVTRSRLQSTLSPLWHVVFSNNHLAVDPHLIRFVLGSHVLVSWQKVIEILLLLVLLLGLSNNRSRLTLVLLSWHESSRLILQKHIIVGLNSRGSSTNCLVRVQLMLIVVESGVVETSLLAYSLPVFYLSLNLGRHLGLHPSLSTVSQNLNVFTKFRALSRSFAALNLDCLISHIVSLMPLNLLSKYLVLLLDYSRWSH